MSGWPREKCSYGRESAPLMCDGCWLRARVCCASVAHAFSLFLVFYMHVQSVCNGFSEVAISLFITPIKHLTYKSQHCQVTSNQPGMTEQLFCVGGESLSTVWRTYGRMHNETAGFDRWLEYADKYERHLPRPSSVGAAAGRPPLRMLEIGVQSGGSTRAWRRCYGDSLYYVGLDVDPRCRAFRSAEESIHIEIGSSLDPRVLRRVCAAARAPDARLAQIMGPHTCTHAHADPRSALGAVRCALSLTRSRPHARLTRALAASVCVCVGRTGLRGARAVRRDHRRRRAHGADDQRGSGATLP